MDRLRTERHPGVCHCGRLESDGVEGRGVGGDGHGGWAGIHSRVEEKEVDTDRNRQQKIGAPRLGNLLSHTEA